MEIVEELNKIIEDSYEGLDDSSEFSETNQIVQDSYEKIVEDSYEGLDDSPDLAKQTKLLKIHMKLFKTRWNLNNQRKTQWTSKNHWLLSSSISLALFSLCGDWAATAVNHLFLVGLSLWILGCADWIILMCNEREHYHQFIGAVCVMDWPKDRMLVQILEDSSDSEMHNLINGTEIIRCFGAITYHQDMQDMKDYYDTLLTDVAATTNRDKAAM
ncbi:hypothetical protein ACFE04_011340 [Oxalis oulophora]